MCLKELPQEAEMLLAELVPVEITGSQFCSEKGCLVGQWQKQKCHQIGLNAFQNYRGKVLWNGTVSLRIEIWYFQKCQSTSS